MRSWRRRNPWRRPIADAEQTRGDPESGRAVHDACGTGGTPGRRPATRQPVAAAATERVGRERGVVLDGNRKAQRAGAKIRWHSSGEVTLGGAERLQCRSLRECLAAEAPVVLDLERVTEIDLAGLQVLVAAERSFAARSSVTHPVRKVRCEKAWDAGGISAGGGDACGKDNHDGG